MTDNSVPTHKEWRRLAKKMRRKRLRQRLADAKSKVERLREQSPTYLTELAKKKLLEEYELQQYELDRRKRHEKWLRDEEEAQKLWKEQMRLKDLAREEKLKELERIRSEWEAEQQVLLQERKRLEKLKEDEERRKLKTIERINDFIENGGEVPHELISVRETNPGKELCSFFSKVGACRFGPQCSRNHQYPGISRVLLFSNFYSHFTLDQSNSSEYDTDIGLEFEDSDMYIHFTEFYRDVAPELKKYGSVKMIKVCCNIEYHLRGNVYVEYGSLREALIAFKKFHGRWYGSKQLNVEFVNIADWGRAVCGDFARKRCPKGKSCNFLHVFRNPKNEYPVEWSHVKNGNNTSLSDSFNSCESPIRDRSFRWSETPQRQISESKDKNVKNINKYRSERRSRRSKSSSRSRSRSRSKSKSRELDKYRSKKERDKCGGYKRHKEGKDKSHSKNSHNIKLRKRE